MNIDEAIQQARDWIASDPDPETRRQLTTYIETKNHALLLEVMSGVLDLGNPEIETAEVVADRIRNGLKHVAADRLVVAPDCGMKYMPRHVAFGKLKAMCDAAATVRKEIS